MNAKAPKKEDSTVLTEILSLKEGNNAGDINSDPKNKKIQEKFDSALDDLFTDPEESFNLDSNESAKSSSPKVDSLLDLEAPSLDFDLGGEESLASEANTGSLDAKDESLTKELDLSDNTGLDFADISIEESFNEATKKTEIANLSDLNFKEDATNELSLLGSEEVAPTLTNEDDDVDFSLDEKTSENSNSNIEATIRNIVAPKNEATGEFKLDDAILEEDQIVKEAVSDKTMEEFSYKANTNSDLTNKNDLGFDLNFQTENSGPKDVSEKTEGLFSVNEIIEAKSDNSNADLKSSISEDLKKTLSSPSFSSVTDDEYVRLQATIRQLREEREDFLEKITGLKLEVREAEQDNLTLKALLDENKIELNISKKRFLNEVEDLKLKAQIADEKRRIAEEKMKNLERIKEKLEQKTRIDLNQIRQREKELESKLELLAIDSDSQVNAREQKILELRRKIDSLEFNMENISIKEQKSIDDKRKLEDKLNKIMKTLRNSIKNLEDDLDEEGGVALRSDNEK